LANLATGGIDYAQQRKNLSDARSDINVGYQTARGDVLREEGPYNDFGQRHIPQYDDMGEFKYGKEEFDLDPSYQWRQDEGQRMTERSMAGRKMLGSGNTLMALQERGQDMAAQEYQAGFTRAKDTYDTNRAYHEFPIETGRQAGQNIGDNLASLALGRGQDNANLQGYQMDVNSRALANLRSQGQPQPGGQPGGQLGSGMRDIMERATEAGLSNDELGQLLPELNYDNYKQWAADGGIGSDMLKVWQDSGIGSNGADFLRDAFSSGGEGYGFDVDPNFANNGLDSLFGPGDIFNPSVLETYDIFDEGFDSAVLNNDGWWDSFTDGIMDFGSDVWDSTGGAVIDWATDFFG